MWILTLTLNQWEGRSWLDLQWQSTLSSLELDHGAHAIRSYGYCMLGSYIQIIEINHLQFKHYSWLGSCCPCTVWDTLYNLPTNSTNVCISMCLYVEYRLSKNVYLISFTLGLCWWPEQVQRGGRDVCLWTQLNMSSSTSSDKLQ